MSLDELSRERQVWQGKPVLRKMYSHEFFARLNEHRMPGKRTLEIGGGPGFYKEFAPDIISSDITPCPWHDLAADGQNLPFAMASFDNIIGLDVVHHLNDPMPFFREAARVLRPAGRIVLIEPWMTLFSYFVNRYFMPEDCDLNWRPGETVVKDKDGQAKDPFEANSAIPYCLFHRYQDRLDELIPGLRLVKVERFALFGYLLSMGFREMTLLPVGLYPFVSRIEKTTRPLWEGVAALKALIVLERI